MAAPERDQVEMAMVAPVRVQVEMEMVAPEQDRAEMAAPERDWAEMVARGQDQVELEMVAPGTAASGRDQAQEGYGGGSIYGSSASSTSSSLLYLYNNKILSIGSGLNCLMGLDSCAHTPRI